MSQENEAEEIKKFLSHAKVEDGKDQKPSPIAQLEGQIEEERQNLIKNRARKQYQDDKQKLLQNIHELQAGGNPVLSMRVFQRGVKEFCSLLVNQECEELKINWSGHQLKMTHEGDSLSKADFIPKSAVELQVNFDMSLRKEYQIKPEREFEISSRKSLLSIPDGTSIILDTPILLMAKCREEFSQELSQKLSHLRLYVCATAIEEVVNLWKAKAIKHGQRLEDSLRRISQGCHIISHGLEEITERAMLQILGESRGVVDCSYRSWLVAQSRSRRLPICTNDRVLLAYEDIEAIAVI